MIDDQTALVKRATAEWAMQKYHPSEIALGSLSLETIAGEEGTCFLVDYAVRNLGRWLVAEVWVEDGAVVNVNDLGEGLPLDERAWPWAADET